MTKEEILLKKHPTADEVAQELARIEMATIEEEQERKQRGLTQEPIAARIKRKTELGGEFVGEEGNKPQKEDFKYYLADWENGHFDYELTHLSQDTKIEPKWNAYDLPRRFVDFLIVEAIGSDLVEDDRHLLFSILRNLNKVIIYNTASTIQIGLRDNEGRLIHLDFEARPPFVFLQAGAVG